MLDLHVIPLTHPEVIVGEESFLPAVGRINQLSVPQKQLQLTALLQLLVASLPGLSQGHPLLPQLLHPLTDLPAASQRGGEPLAQGLEVVKPGVAREKGEDSATFLFLLAVLR